MAEDRILLTDDFIASAYKLPKNIQSKIWKSLYLLMKNAQHPSLQVKQLRTGRKGIMEGRIDETYRLIFESIDNGPIRVWFVAHHDEALAYGTRIPEPRPAKLEYPVYPDHLLHELDL